MAPSNGVDEGGVEIDSHHPPAGKVGQQTFDIAPRSAAGIQDDCVGLDLGLLERPVEARSVAGTFPRQLIVQHEEGVVGIDHVHMIVGARGRGPLVVVFDRPAPVGVRVGRGPAGLLDQVVEVVGPVSEHILDALALAGKHEQVALVGHAR